MLPSDRVVPIDVVLDDETFAVVITGPNTGGKTVSLKTIGLLILMAQSGLHIPVQSGSEMSLFKNVFADIGDEQSIEQSLSTFSGHITNIVRILNQANARTMVLLDELGSGTDPQEGAALARALLQYLTKKRIPSFVATHFSELKAFAHVTAGVANASMEFDLRTLRPTYRLSIGLPGRSNALLIAERLGLPAEILAAARETIDPAEVNAENLLDEIHRQHDAARKARSQADRMRSLAERDQRLLQKKLEELEQEKEKILQETHNETEEELNSLRQSLTKLRREYDRARLPLTELKALETELKETAKTAKGIDKQLARGSQRRLRDFESEPLKVGEKVRVRSLGTNALAIVTGIEKEEVEILLGSLRMRIPQHDVMRKADEEEETEPQEDYRADKPGKNRTAGTSAQLSQGNRTLFRESPGTEIDLRGKTAEEMIPELETYLDNAVLARLPFVRVIHGKGTGKLRQVTRRHLLDSPYVKYIENGRDAEGGEGVTIAHLRD